jgi:hypothetical protein
VNHEENIIQIQRVQNGWIVRGWSMGFQSRDGYDCSRTMVASTPDQLAEMIRDWAAKQDDAA